MLVELLNSQTSWPLIAATLKRTVQAAQHRAQKLRRLGVEMGMTVKDNDLEKG
jgi:hypothetical protein